MVSENSRYYECEHARVSIIDGSGRPREVTYLRRRFLPPLSDIGIDTDQEGSPTLAESGMQVTALGQTLRAHVVDACDRLDILAWLALGDPLLFWRIADSNPCIFPDEVTEEPGTWIVVPEGAGRSLIPLRSF
ncbi:hypothetical protein [Schlesneria paludicola]|uniref:hypothetical protein n=1 Tax=Schlesneria paludicola TaxID=360056 RepID=UPI00029A2211|nr:hypothetical protein [Schlesneria paludicola]